MMKRAHCEQCRRPAVGCYCHLLQEHDNQCPVMILQDAREAKHSLGTARIAELGLQKCEVHVLENCDGRDPFSLAMINRILANSPVLVYPGAETAVPASTIMQALQPLLFIDATWRRSRKIILEFPPLANLPRLSLIHTPASRYRIRSAREKGALSTLEAIVYSLQFVEDNHNNYRQLFDVMDWLVSDQISHMGDTIYKQNYRD